MSKRISTQNVATFILRYKSGAPLYHLCNKSSDFVYLYNIFFSETRKLKALPIRKKTGDLFHHPDVPALNMDELFLESAASEQDQNLMDRQPHNQIRAKYFAWLNTDPAKVCRSKS